MPIVLLVEPGEGLRRLYGDELRSAGYSVRAVETWDEARGAIEEPPSPAAIVVNASITPELAALFVREVRADARVRDVPVLGIAFASGAGLGILEAGAQCCMRGLPTPADVLKAVRWAEAVYGDGSSPRRVDDA